MTKVDIKQRYGAETPGYDLPAENYTKKLREKNNF
jgi:hypothetical protein